MNDDNIVGDIKVFCQLKYCLIRSSTGSHLMGLEGDIGECLMNKALAFFFSLIIQYLGEGEFEPWMSQMKTPRGAT